MDHGQGQTLRPTVGRHSVHLELALCPHGHCWGSTPPISSLLLSIPCVFLLFWFKFLSQDISHSQTQVSTYRVLSIYSTILRFSEARLENVSYFCLNKKWQKNGFPGFHSMEAPSQFLLPLYPSCLLVSSHTEPSTSCFANILQLLAQLLAQYCNVCPHIKVLPYSLGQ